MDYKKEYDDICQKLMSAYNTTSFIEVRKAIEGIHPELRESEDERIRRTLAEYFGPEVQLDFVRGVPIQKIRDWLEKQKEPHYTKRNALFDKCVENCDPEVMKEVSDKVDEMLRKEQKPVEIHIDNPNIQKFDPDVKVTTSDSSADGKELLYVSNKSYDIGFRDGVASVKPVEWSEDDENALKYIHELISWGYAEKFMDAQTAHDMRKWVNEHRSRDTFQNGNSHWKPSEGQMSILLAVLNDPNNAGAESCQTALKSLYQQLKKLM